MALTPEPSEQRPYWFVGASYGGTDDRTAEFLRKEFGVMAGKTDTWIRSGPCSQETALQ